MHCKTVVQVIKTILCETATKSCIFEYSLLPSITLPFQVEEPAPPE